MQSPTKYPTSKPTNTPTTSPSASPTISPSANPTNSPSVSPTVSPTTSPSKVPSESPSSLPSRNPSSFPSTVPSDLPSLFPSTFPSAIPSSPPSDVPSLVPSSGPSAVPTKSPEAIPTTSPTHNPTLAPTKTPSTSPSQSPVIPCGTRARKVKIESTTQQSIHVFEVQVFSSGSNVAVGKAATQSSTFQNFGASRAVDGSAKSFSHTKDAFSSPSWDSDTSPWWEVDLGELFHIEKVHVLNRFCADPSDPNGCLCHLTNATLSLRDQNDLVVATKSFGDTCGVLTVKESFADDSPSCTVAIDTDSLELTADDTETDETASSVGMVVPLTLVSIVVFLGLASLAYIGRKRKQQQQKEYRRTDDNISPHDRKYSRQRSKGLHRKANGEDVLSSFEDMNLMVEVKNSAAGGWNCVLDQDSLEHFDFTSVSANSAEATNPGSLQDLEEIEKSVDNVRRDAAREEASDEDLVNAYKEAMAMDEEPESEVTAALTRKYNPLASGEAENDADAFLTDRMPSLGHDIT
ncbi:hypothetical protein HJC23_004201 [Cyclotella cryptica]|uniref:Fucolectin tachylectin-4 pentraxin-1 domain-containing protein n=1 Tax=Cyclotella cryptica TaxID=29204 RepID=A0ABD3Q7B3_9STRA